MDIRTLEKFFTNKIDKEMCKNVDTVEDRIQNAVLTSIDNVITPRIELEVRSMNASSRRDAASVKATSERGEDIGTTASFEKMIRTIHFMY